MYKMPWKKPTIIIIIYTNYKQRLKIRQLENNFADI